MAKSKTGPKYVVCVDNTDADDLTKWKVYRVLADAAAAKSDHLRVVDDSDEDYLYPAECFAPVRLSPAAEKRLRSANT